MWDSLLGGIYRPAFRTGAARVLERELALNAMEARRRIIGGREDHLLMMELSSQEADTSDRGGMKAIWKQLVSKGGRSIC